MIRVVNPRTPISAITINTTSRSRNWSRGLSPFFLGPVPLYEGAPCPEATCVENAWQGAKVYPIQVGPAGDPMPAYFDWARGVFTSERALRYPMGKGAVPAYSWWGDAPLPYVEARKRIYIPIYARLVVKTDAFAQLLRLYRRWGKIDLWDFDGYDHHALGMSLKDVINSDTRKMGHAFVLAILLERMA